RRRGGSCAGHRRRERTLALRGLADRGHRRLAAARVRLQRRRGPCFRPVARAPRLDAGSHRSTAPRVNSDRSTVPPGPGPTASSLWFNAPMAETGTEARPPLLQANAALYLDFDGTLAALAPHPAGVNIEDSLPALLAGVRACLDGAVALVTGRSLAALDALTGLPRYAGAGLHGLEWR